VNKADLVSHVSADVGISKREANEAVDSFLAAIQSALTKGEKVTLPGFGTFERRARAARTGRNPQTGAAIKVAATKVPAFKAGAALKQAVSGKKAAAKGKPKAKAKSKRR
jgi:DNA-binding protein HU-beta